MTDLSPLTLPEYDTQEYDTDDLPQAVGEEIWEDYSTQIDVDFPSPRTNGQWQLRNKGYAGHIKLSEDWALELEPKVTTTNIFAMLEHAYSLSSFEFLDGLYDADSIEGYYDRIAKTLAQNVIQRQRKGLHKSYVDREEQSTVVRGDIDFAKDARRPWDAEKPIEYRELTVDIEDNQLLLWTLFKILSNGHASEETMQIVRRAYRSLSGMVSLNEFRAQDCVGRTYRRLNQDYESLHALCHLILDNSGPTRISGEHKMMPFIVGMARLYEEFVANWVAEHLPTGYSRNKQETVPLNSSGLNYDIDLVVYDDEDSPICVADTKYKVPKSPDTSDISQVVAYATAKDVSEAFLIYPEDLENSIDVTIGEIRVRTLTFALDGNLDENGENFLRNLLQSLRLK